MYLTGLLESSFRYAPDNTYTYEGSDGIEHISTHSYQTEVHTLYEQFNVGDLEHPGGLTSTQKTELTQEIEKWEQASDSKNQAKYTEFLADINQGYLTNQQGEKISTYVMYLYDQEASPAMRGIGLYGYDQTTSVSKTSCGDNETSNIRRLGALRRTGKKFYF